LLDLSAMQLQNGGEWDPQFLPRAAKANKLKEIIRKEIVDGENKVRSIGLRCQESLEPASVSEQRVANQAAELVSLSRQ
jgi:hypothetical protein